LTIINVVIFFYALLARTTGPNVPASICEKMKTIVNRKILVPYDFERGYKHALSVAEKIAEASGASITLLHAVNPGRIMAGPVPLGSSQPHI